MSVISSSQRPLPTQHPTNANDKIACSQLNSKPRTHQISSLKPTLLDCTAAWSACLYYIILYYVTLYYITSIQLVFMFQNVSKLLRDLYPDLFTLMFIRDVVKFLHSPQIPPLFYVVTKFSIFHTIHAYFIKSTNLTELGLLQNNVRFSPDHYFPSSRCWFSCFLGTNEFWQTPPSPLNTRCIFVTSYVHLSPLSSSLQFCPLLTPLPNT